MAKVASTASAGSVGVSSAITSMPCCRALSIEGTIAFESFGVIRKPLAPAEIRLSIACTCASLSPSCLPANVCSLTPASFAAALAPSFILTKKGFVSVLVIRPTIGLSELPPSPHPASAGTAMTTAVSTMASRGAAHWWIMSHYLSSEAAANSADLSTRRPPRPGRYADSPLSAR